MLEQAAKRPEALAAEVAELRDHETLDRGVEFPKQPKPMCRNARGHDAPVRFSPCAANEPACFEPVEQARDVRVVGHHSGADLAASKPLRLGPTQDAQHVVLRWRQLGWFQSLGETPHQDLRRPLKIEEYRFSARNGFVFLISF
jgi:hypothetical protein